MEAFALRLASRFLVRLRLVLRLAAANICSSSSSMSASASPFSSPSPSPSPSQLVSISISPLSSRSGVVKSKGGNTSLKLCFFLSIFFFELAGVNCTFARMIPLWLSSLAFGSKNAFFPPTLAGLVPFVTGEEPPRSESKTFPNPFLLILRLAERSRTPPDATLVMKLLCGLGAPERSVKGLAGVKLR